MKYLRFTQDKAGKVTVHAGARIVGTIRGRYVRADVEHVEAINAFVGSVTGAFPVEEV